VRVVVSVVDRGGSPIALLRMDGAFLFSVEAAQKKAWTAAAAGFPTDRLRSGFNQDPTLLHGLAPEVDQLMAVGGGPPGAIHAAVAGPLGPEGNHSIVLNWGEGLTVTSENGIAPDCYAPASSRIPGLRAYAQRGMDVVLNGNTLERGLDQYLSMVLEKTIAGPSQRDPCFPAFLASSELTAAWYAPGIAPTLAYGDVTYGAL